MPDKISSHNWVYMRTDEELQANFQQMLDVLNTDLDYVRVHTRLQERALQWERAKKNPSFHLQGDELVDAEKWLEGAGAKKPQPTSSHIEFIQASRRAANQRQRVLLTASLVGLGIAIILAIISFGFFLQAKNAEGIAQNALNSAQTAQVDAVNNYNLAATAQVEADNGRKEAVEQANNAATAQANAEAAQAEAEDARTEAENQRAEAITQALNAQAGELAASGLAQIDKNPPLAALLALESNQLAPDNNTAKEVLSLLPSYYPPLTDVLIEPTKFYINDLAWSTSGQLASSYRDDTIVLWNLDTHEPDLIISGQTMTITAIAWSENGQLASGSDDGSVIVWNLQTGEPETVLPILQGGITSLAWSNRGRLTSASWDGSIIIWDLVNQREETILYSDAGVNAIAWSSFGQLASGGWDGAVTIWNVQSQTADVVYTDHESGILTLAWNPDGSLASGSADSTIAIRNSFGTYQTTLRGHTDYVNAVGWSQEGQLASASWDGTVILWDIENSKPAQIYRGHTGSVDALAWGRNGQLASGGDFLYLWDTKIAPAISVYPGHLNWVGSLAWTPDGQLISNGWDGSYIFWDNDTGEITEKGNSGGDGLDLSANNLLLAGSNLLNRNTGAEYYLNGYDLAFSPDENFALGFSYGAVNTFAVWDLAHLFETGEVISQTFSVDTDLHINDLAWSPDGNSIASALDDGSILIWNFATGEVSTNLSANETWVTALAWNEDGRLASASDDNTIIIWNGNTFEQEHILSGGHLNGIQAVSWGPEGEFASADRDGFIVIWDLEAERPLTFVRAPYKGAIYDLAWSTDGAKLAFSGESYNVYIYNTAYALHPCTWLPRNMTEWEWYTYFPDEPYHKTCEELPSSVSILGEGASYAAHGDIETALELYSEAELQGVEITAYDWNSLCWFGSLYNQAEAVLFACDNAVALDPENGDTLDSRGVARALLGDYEGAIADFEAFISYGQTQGYPESEIAKREAWIEALRAGINPFDEETLASLRK